MPLGAQYDAPPAPSAYALQDVTLYQADGRETRGVTLVMRRGLVQAIGTNVAIPPDALVLEGDSLRVYPGFVDAHGGAKIEMPQPQIDRDQLEPWDAPREVRGFTPHRRAADYLSVNGAGLEDERRAGVVAGAAHPDGPVMPGRGAVLIYRKSATTPSQLVVRPELGPLFTFEGARGAYPGTFFGVVAFMRQSFEDARHDGVMRQAHARDPRGLKTPAWDADYDVLRSVLDRRAPVFFVADDAEEIRIVLRLAEQHGFQPVIVGGGEAWRVADQLRARDVAVLVSLDFPEPERWKPDKGESDTAQVTEPLDPAAEREQRRLEDLYANAGRLVGAGVRVGLTSGGGQTDIRKGARKAIEYGLDATAALLASTLTPATLLDIAHVARVEEGMPATFIVTDGPLFDEETAIRYTFVEGELEKGKTATPAAGEEAPSIDVSGTWNVSMEGEGQRFSGTMTLEQEGATFSGTMEIEFGTLRVRDGSVSGSDMSFTLVIPMGDETMEADVSGSVTGDAATGKGSGEMGSFTWTATRVGTPDEEVLR
jgi:imidazolonepropionase-like amidohydrolase